MSDPSRDVLGEFLNGLTQEEYAALSDASVERLEQLARDAYAEAWERLNEFRAAHPAFRDSPHDAN